MTFKDVPLCRLHHAVMLAVIIAAFIQSIKEDSLSALWHESCLGETLFRFYALQSTFEQVLILTV